MTVRQNYNYNYLHNVQTPRKSHSSHTSAELIPKTQRNTSMSHLTSLSQHSLSTHNLVFLSSIKKNRQTRKKVV